MASRAPEPPAIGGRMDDSNVSSSALRPPGQSILRSSRSTRMSGSVNSIKSGNSTRSTDSTERRTATLFRNFFSQRRKDYPFDAPSGLHDAPSRGVRHASFQQHSPPTTVEAPDEKQCRDYLRPPPWALNIMSTIMESRLYHAITIFNTILLLFGSQIQELWIPPAGDTAMDVLYTIALAVFSGDIVMRICTEPGYFVTPKLCCTKDKTQSRWGRCGLGSFMFWCDLMSTATLLYVISYINKAYYETIEYNIGLDSFGIPDSGLEEVNQALPIELEFELIILIGRTARVARFIRESTVTKSGSFINWYFLFQRINPLWYWDRYRQSRAATGAPTDSNSTSATQTTREKSGSSWSELQEAILAKTRSRQKETSEKKHGIKGMRDKALGLIGFRRAHHNEEMRRQIAASKIQRAWRATVSQHEKDYSEHVAWSSQRGGPTPGHRMKLKNLSRRSSVARNFHIPKNVNRTISGESALSTSPARSRRPESQVGSAMRELTGQRVALGIIIALVLTVLFTYSEDNATVPSAMIVLHTQTENAQYADVALDAARASAIPDLYEYVFANNSTSTFEISENPENLRDREILRVSVVDPSGNQTVGYFSIRDEQRANAAVGILATLFILLVWFFGVTAFAGPVMTLVVIPIERMVRLLGMLMVDPLGYQSTSRYKKFVAEEDELTKNTRWTKEVLKGMETSFLMSTILRIGSLMKVGFGSAGVEIIRNNLEKGQSKNMLILNSQGSTVSCIFLFCDIRQFTDATECLQEEVFVFTNRIAGVVHSICHSYGGSANKNIGDAFLLSWLLDDPNSGDVNEYATNESGADFMAKNSQADKALLSVVKINIALHFDKYYLEPVSEGAREALLAKLSKRPGPVVQMGCGLHAGKAVQGAIGSQRKIDATYVSEAVEKAEFLESSTKKYGLRMLMSDSFHGLLHPSNRRRCRKIDQIRVNEEEDDEEAAAETMELFTFDMDIDALWRPPPAPAKMAGAVIDDNVSDYSSSSTRSIPVEKGAPTKRDITRTQSVKGAGLLKIPRRQSLNRIRSGGKKDDDSSDEIKVAASTAAAAVAAGGNGSPDLSEEITFKKPVLVLPTGSAFYNANVWLSDDMRRIRERYSDGLFFQKFNSGFLSYYARDWDHAKQCFQTILERFDDGPSRYFLKCIEDNGGVPPRDFHSYSK